MNGFTKLLGENLEIIKYYKSYCHFIHIVNDMPFLDEGQCTHCIFYTIPQICISTRMESYKVK